MISHPQNRFYFVLKKAKGHHQQNKSLYGALEIASPISRLQISLPFQDPQIGVVQRFQNSQTNEAT